MKPRLHIFTTGGTIASVATFGGGATPQLRGEDLLAAIPGVRDWADLQVEPVVQAPGAHLELETLVAVSRRAHDILESGRVDGVVITQGTDTIDESAYFLDLTVRSERPIVVTGAMRNPSLLGADGPKNLHDALRVAADRASCGIGTVVVFNDEIHAARSVAKAHSQSPAAFVSPATGEIGCVVGSEVHYYVAVPPRRSYLAPRIEPRVEILKLGIEPSLLLLRACLDGGVRGIVVEGLGGGRFPPHYAAALGEAVASGCTVVVTGRAGRGRTWDPYGFDGAFAHLASLGIVFGHNLSSQKLRIKLMLALANLRTPADIKEYIENE